MYAQLIAPQSHILLANCPTKFENEQGPKFDEKTDGDALYVEQTKLYASKAKGLLVVLQGLDASGKDGASKHLLRFLHPQGSRVVSFKVPNETERLHDYLWRVHAQMPARGEVVVFNRSHYEDLVVPAVKGGAQGKQLATQRASQVNAFEALLVENGIEVLKVFLHISKTEQKERLEARLNDPTKLWKISPEDFADRLLWNDYWDVYSKVISSTSTSAAPWFVLPADSKKQRNAALATLVLEHLKRLKLTFPQVHFNPSTVHLAD